jgi:AbiTii
MSSLVEELQRDSLNANVKVSDLLRKAKAIAVKLDLPELEKWVENELNGYPPDGDFPEYRKVTGQLKGQNPFHGWLPVIIDQPDAAEAFSTRHIFQRVAELESVANSSGSQLTIPLTDEAKLVLMKITRSNADFTLFVTKSAVVGILDSVRNSLLEWSLKLEKADVKGEGMSFSSDERKKAHETQAVIHIGSIGTFTGTMGSGSGDFTVQGDVVNSDSKAAIESLVRKIRENEAQLGLEPDSTGELNQALDGLQSEIKTAQPSAKRVNGFLTSIRGVAEKAAGSLVAQGILYEIAKLMH